MTRWIIPVSLGAALIALLGVSQAVKAEDEKVSVVQVHVVCDKRTIDEHLALIEADVTYSLVRDRLQDDLAVGVCVRTPPVPLPVLEQGRQVTLTDSDGDVMRITVVRVAQDAWTLHGRIVGKGS